jgi:hypothetical protein
LPRVFAKLRDECKFKITSITHLAMTKLSLKDMIDYLTMMTKVTPFDARPVPFVKISLVRISSLKSYHIKIVIFIDIIF